MIIVVVVVVVVVVFVAVVVIVVLTLARMIKSVVTGQAPVTLELRNTQGKNRSKPKVVHAYITADAIHAFTRNIYKVKSGVSLRCAKSILVHIRHTSRAWKNRLYRLPPKKDYHVNITRSTYHYAYARQTQVT